MDWKTTRTDSLLSQTVTMISNPGFVSVGNCITAVVTVGQRSHSCNDSTSTPKPIRSTVKEFKRGLPNLSPIYDHALSTFGHMFAAFYGQMSNTQNSLIFRNCIICEARSPKSRANHNFCSVLYFEKLRKKSNFRSTFSIFRLRRKINQVALRATYSSSLRPFLGCQSTTKPLHLTSRKKTI